MTESAFTYESSAGFGRTTSEAKLLKRLILRLRDPLSGCSVSMRLFGTAAAAIAAPATAATPKKTRVPLWAGPPLTRAPAIPPATPLLPALPFSKPLVLVLVLVLDADSLDDSLLLLSLDDDEDDELPVEGWGGFGG